MAQPVGGSHPALDAAGDERPTSLVPTHPADIAEDAARRAVEGIGIPDLATRGQRANGPVQGEGGRAPRSQ
ncbi:hypothetical protein [Allorhizocola rhizosphaerae]|uniref:hypothetical protein n=1 Tax=Allorhizocola rhizosphaerae TaxID=1872709 RepID=UPI0013C35099|nr:hypothetical protein [Allorhizocola rhizosphaerae]